MTKIAIPRLITEKPGGSSMEWMMQEYRNSILRQTGSENPKAAKKIMALR